MELIHILGDLQDTPGTSNMFYYGSCRLSKHPLGIIKMCKYWIRMHYIQAWGHIAKTNCIMTWTQRRQILR